MKYIFLWLIVLGGVYLGVRVFAAPTIVPYAQMKREGLPTFLCARLAEKSGGGTTLLQMKTGVSQHFGEGATCSLSEDRAIVFSSAGDQFYLADENQIQTISLQQNAPRTKDIRANASFDRLVIQGESEQGSVFCLFALTPESTAVCSDLTLNKEAQARWDPEWPEQLILLTVDGNLYRKNAAQNTMKFVDDSDPELERLRALFNPAQHAPIPRSLRWHRAFWGAEQARMAGDMALFAKRSGLYLYDPQTRGMAQLLNVQVLAF